MTDTTAEKLREALGPGFVVLRELGGGGMSRVFVVRDESLGRDIVVKQLPPDAAAALSTERFHREISLAARLQHPHIVPVLGAGRTGDALPYYTMPFVEGESLRARLDRAGELPVAETVSILREVARALQYAHERGIVHRDIKPGNIMLSGGAALVTDFGVAKAVSASTTGERSAVLTQLGVALGTPAYMAPEQAAAESSVDHRADIYAFGCVAYEMLTGSPPFAGRNASSLLAAQVSEMPEPVQRRRPATPPELSALVMECLAKRASDRPQSGAELIARLDRVSSTTSGDATIAAAPRSSRLRMLAPWALAVTAGIVAVAFAIRDRAQVDDSPVVRFTLDASPLRVGGGGGWQTFALSPNGTGLVYRGATARGVQLFWRPFDGLEARAIAGTEDGISPVFTPDGRALLFVANDHLKRVPIEGGIPLDLGVAGSGGGIAFLPDGRTVLGNSRAFRGLTMLSAGDNARSRLVDADTARGELWLSSPVVIADGKWILYTANVRSALLGAAEAAVVEVATGRSRALGLPSLRVIGVANGQLVSLSQEGQLQLHPFDEQEARITGPPIPVLDAIGVNSAVLGADGTLLYLTAAPQRIVRRDLSGQVVATLYTSRAAFRLADARVSRDGKRVIVSSMEVGRPRNLFVLDVATGALARATNGASEWTGVFTSDGRRIVYPSSRDSVRAIYQQSLDAGTDPRLVHKVSGSFLGLTPDDRQALYTIGRGGSRDVYSVPMSGGTPVGILTGPSAESQAAVSPDGQFIAYVSDVTGRDEVWLRRFPSLADATLISRTGATQPRWHPDSRQLFYRANGVQRLAGLDVTRAIRVVSDDSLFATDFDAPGGFGNFDIDADGRHIIEVVSVHEAQRLVVVLNWTREVGQGKR